MKVEWTKHEVRLIRRRISYYQRRRLKDVRVEEAIAILDEQQRRHEKHFAGTRNYLNSWYGEGIERA